MGMVFYPRKVDGLMGIFWSPLLHADFAHLIANSGPLVLLLIMLFLTQAIPTQVESRIHLVGKRPGNVAYRPSGHSHWCQFHCLRAGCFFDDGFILDEKLASLFFLSILALLMFGGLFYGLFHIQKGVSWEGHLSGVLAGVWVAWLMHARHA